LQGGYPPCKNEPTPELSTSQQSKPATFTRELRVRLN
jgi:hypothetical protein